MRAGLLLNLVILGLFVVVLLFGFLLAALNYWGPGGPAIATFPR